MVYDLMIEDLRESDVRRGGKGFQDLEKNVDLSVPLQCGGCILN